MSLQDGLMRNRGGHSLLTSKLYTPAAHLRYLFRVSEYHPSANVPISQTYLEQAVLKKSRMSFAKPRKTLTIASNGRLFVDCSSLHRTAFNEQPTCLICSFKRLYTGHIHLCYLIQGIHSPSGGYQHISLSQT